MDRDLGLGRKEVLDFAQLYGPRAELFELLKEHHLTDKYKKGEAGSKRVV
jgi:hypothetical protein